MISLTPSDTAPGFDHPLELLRACHGKILKQCDTLQKLSLHIKTKGCDTQAMQAAAGILRYFDTAGQFHHQDEEQDLFPVLRACSGMQTELLDRLLHEHEGMQVAWDALRPALEQLARGGYVELDAAVCGNFIGRYTVHIETENNSLLPLAEKLLSAQQLVDAGRKMAQRRGAKFQ